MAIQDAELAMKASHSQTNLETELFQGSEVSVGPVGQGVKNMYRYHRIIVTNILHISFLIKMPIKFLTLPFTFCICISCISASWHGYIGYSRGLGEHLTDPSLLGLCDEI